MPFTFDANNNLDVNIKAGGTGGGTVDQGNQGTAAEGWFVEITDGTNVLGTSTDPVKIDPTGTTTQPVSGTVTANAGTNLNTSTLALESGGNLAAIKADTDKIPSQGQALSAASMPVVLPAAQITTLTPPAAITNYAEETGGNLAAIKTDTDTLAGAVSSGVMKVNTKTALTASSPTATSVGITSVSAVASNTNRKGLILVNTSSNYISLGFGSAAVLYSGVTLAPFGTFCMDEYSFNTGAVNAIASGATSNLAIQEFTT